MQQYAEQFYKSNTWQACRQMVYTRDGGLCQDCLSRGIITAGVEVHHIEPVTPQNIFDPGITLNPDNLILLCKFCHRQRHDKKIKRYSVDEAGRVLMQR